MCVSVCAERELLVIVGATAFAGLDCERFKVIVVVLIIVVVIIVVDSFS